MDLATWLSDQLGPGPKINETIIPLDSIPLEVVEIENVAARIGALLVAVGPNQRAPDLPGRWLWFC